MTGRWEVQLPDDLAARARETAREVAARLRDPERLRHAVRQAPQQSMFADDARWRPHELAGGHLGLAILFAGCDDAFPGEDWAIAAQAHLEVAAEAAEARQNIPASLFHGLAGLGFARLLIGDEAPADEDLLRRAEAAADRVAGAEEFVSERDFDVVSGLAGVGAYLLSIPGSSPALDRDLHALVRLAQAHGPTPGWYTPPHLLDEEAREHYPQGRFNCGLAHGIPGPLALLSLADAQGVAVDGVVAAIERITRWLVEQRLEDDWGTTWPSAVTLGPVRPEPSRSAWCYGPPGVARSLWLAGDTLDDSGLRDLAVAAMSAVYRRPIPKRGIDSPTFCHGVAGLLQITLRFAQDTGLPLFREEAAKLAMQLLDAYDRGSLLGYCDVEPDGRLVDRASLVNGAAGVALVLLAASSPFEPAWDRMFLLS